MLRNITQHNMTSIREIIFQNDAAKNSTNQIISYVKYCFLSLVHRTEILNLQQRGERASVLRTLKSQVELEKERETLAGFPAPGCMYVTWHLMKRARLFQLLASQLSVLKSHQHLTFLHCQNTTFTSTLTFYSFRKVKSNMGQYVCMAL